MRFSVVAIVVAIVNTVPLAAYDDSIAYLAPGGDVAVSFSICAKCGSTSLFRALFRAIYGRDYQNRGRPWVHNWKFWPARGRPAGSELIPAQHLHNKTLKWKHFHVVRDPVERYISAFFSKLRCCEVGETGPGGDPPRSKELAVDAAHAAIARKVCAYDVRDTPVILRSLIRAANSAATNESLFADPILMLLKEPTAKCVYFGEYVHLLAVANRGKKTLNPHIRPQTVPATMPGRDLWIGTIAELESSLNTFIDTAKVDGLRHIVVRTQHQSNRKGLYPDANSLAALCLLSAFEQKQLGMSEKPQC